MKKACLLLVSLGVLSAANAATMVGVTANNELVRFDSSTPSTFESTVAISGLVASDGVTADPGARITDLAYNVSNGLHYGIDSNANFYQVNMDGSTMLLSSSFSPNGFDAGFDYDPLSGRFVFASDLAEHASLTISGTITNYADLAYGAGDANQATVPVIFGTAFDPDFGTAWFIDSNLNTLAQSFDIGLGELFTVGSLGMDVSSFGELMMDANGNLFATLSTDAIESGLYQIDTVTGQASLIGNFGTGMSAITAVPEPSAMMLAMLSVLPLLRRRRA